MTNSHATPSPDTQPDHGKNSAGSTELDNEVFLTELAALLETKLSAQLSPGGRADILRDISSLLADGTPLESFGSPEELVEHIRESLSDVSETDNPELHIDFPGKYSLTDSTWNLQDPRIFVPRRLGAGWDINIGALAVKTGILRPDDVDDEVLNAIPHFLLTMLRWSPAALAAMNAALVIAATRRGKAQLLSTTIRGRVKRYWPLRFGAVIAAAFPAIISALVFVRPAGKRDQISRIAMANSLNTAFAFNSYAALKTENNHTSGKLLALGGFSTVLIDTQLPIALVRIGRSRVTQHAQNKPQG
ncbi:hypothetical protein I6E29_05280 [Arcanobacterium haemolyticum]|nr:hypothetical protein [Arcanobacterium haemolyticum]